MKSLIGFIAFAVLSIGMTACGDGGAAEKAKMALDSTRVADSLAKIEMAAKAMQDSLAALPKTIAESTAGTISTLVGEAGLAEALKDTAAMTVFAPSDEAFGAVQEQVDMLRKSENKAKLASVLKYHVVKGKLMAADLKDGMKLKSLQGEELKVTVKDGKVMINDAEVTATDKTATNGTIHTLNKVLMPKKM